MRLVIIPIDNQRAWEFNQLDCGTKEWINNELKDAVAAKILQSRDKEIYIIALVN